MPRSSRAAGAACPWVFRRSPSPDPLPTIWGHHENCSGAVGDDVGEDVFRIHLDNGWVLAKVVSHDIDKTSADEHFDAIQFHPGRSNDDFDFDWTVSPGDSITYSYWILIRGPRGTTHR